MNRSSTGLIYDKTMDDDTDDKDDTKRRSRNLSEKKRRDQFNMLINELSSIVSTSNRKMDKSTVLKSTIAFLKNHNELAARSRAHEIQEDWKPSFLSNEEFTHLILEALDGFIIVFSSCGRIFYVSGSITSLLGHLPSDMMNMTIYDMLYDEDQAALYNLLLNPSNAVDISMANIGKENQIEFTCHIRRGILDFREEAIYELVHFVGYFRSDVDGMEVDNVVSSTNRYSGEQDSRLVFVGTGRLQTPQLIREMTLGETTKSEFTSRHNLDWKFLALDARATPIIGYVQLEVVGTSGYDYYHVDDLEKIVVCHESLMEKGEGTSCYYRFLTKGQQWVWLQTRFFISYHQWNSKPEFIVCTHKVVSYVDVMIQSRKDPVDLERSQDSVSDVGLGDSAPSRRCTADQVVSSPWSSKSSVGKASHLTHAEVASPASVAKVRSRNSIQGPGSDSTSMSADSPGSRHSQLTTLSVRSQRGHSSSNVRQPPTPSKPSPVSPAQSTSTFLEPQPQYVAAIPIQPILTGFPGPAAVVTSLPPQELLLHQPNQIQDHVKRKQQELQQLRQLMFQKEEELQHFVMAQARYGIIPSLLNVTVPYTVSSTTQQAGVAVPISTPSVSSEIYVPTHSLVGSPLTVTSMPSANVRSYQAASGSNDPQQGVNQSQSLTRPDSEVIPFQFSQQQAQLLFTSNMSSPNSTQNSH